MKHVIFLKIERKKQDLRFSRISFISKSPPQASLTLYEKEVPATRQIVDIMSDTGEQNEPWFMRINPKGLVPVLKHGDKIICESEAIIEYVDKNTSGKLCLQNILNNLSTATAN